MASSLKTDIESVPAEIKGSLLQPLTQPSDSEANFIGLHLHLPTSRRAILLALSPILLIILNVLIGHPDVPSHSKGLYEVRPFNLFSGANEVIPSIVEGLPQTSMMVWTTQMLSACGEQGRVRWRNVLFVFTALTVMNVVGQLVMDVVRDLLGISRLGVLGIWKPKECFELHGRRFCRDYSVEEVKWVSV